MRAANMPSQAHSDLASGLLPQSADKPSPSPAISPVILNVFSTFAIGGPQIRFAALANSPEHRFRELVFAMDGRYDCFDRLKSNARVDRSHFDFPRRGTTANVITAYRVLRRLNPDLLVTYNWGAIEWALAATLAKATHVHIVDGFGPEEAESQFIRRVLFRRIALARCSRVVVPSNTLYQLAREVWRLPANQLTRIPNGIDVDRVTQQTDERLIYALGIPRDRKIIGTVATLRPEKNIARLLRATAEVANRMPAALVIVGDGAERQALEAQALAIGLSEKVIFTGAAADPAKLLGAFDVFAISSDTEQMPMSVLEAMAAGLPIASVDVGDVKEMVSPENAPYVLGQDSKTLAAAILDLLSDADARRRIGAANRQRARKDYTLDCMARSYTNLFSALIQSACRAQPA
jgi:glycosyltransferase involved in cell wall biosynthesis